MMNKEIAEHYSIDYSAYRRVNKAGAKVFESEKKSITFVCPVPHEAFAHAYMQYTSNYDTPSLHFNYNKSYLTKSAFTAIVSTLCKLMSQEEEPTIYEPGPVTAVKIRA